MTPTFDYEHVVTFDETNVVGNVYFVHHLRWQGHCRELFLRERAPGVLAQLEDGLVLVTTRCSCEYFGELVARGEQQVACLRRDGLVLEPTSVPAELRAALQPYADGAAR